MSGLPQGWIDTTLEEIAEIHNVSRIPLSTKQRNQKKGTYPYYGASGIIDYIDEYIFDGEYVLISEDGENLNTRKTPIAFKANGKFWVNNHAHIVKGSDSYLNDYIVYYFKNTNLSPYITGAAQPKLSKGNLLSIPFVLPENKQEQKSIAKLLSSFDKKIELLRGQNETLETLAQTVFKEWFVNFSYPDTTGEMVDSELGEIPKDWRVSCVYDLAKYVNGAAYKNIHFSKNSTGLPVIKIVELKSGISKQTKFTEIDLGEKFKIDNGDILFSWSGSPETSIDIFIWTLDKAYLNQHIFKVIPDISLGKYYVYNVLKYLKPIFISIAKMKQTTGLGHITNNDLKKLLFVIPDETTLKSFTDIIKPIYDKKYLANIQTQTLTKTRDTLLPKLMSGEVRVN